jgi:arylsulfatase A-like enzyme
LIIFQFKEVEFLECQDKHNINLIIEPYNKFVLFNKNSRVFFILFILIFLTTLNCCSPKPKVYRFDDHLNDAKVASESKKAVKKPKAKSIIFDFDKKESGWIELGNSFKLENRKGYLHIAALPLQKIEVEFPKQLGEGTVQLQVLNPPYNDEHSSAIVSIEVIQSESEGKKAAQSIIARSQSSVEKKPMIKQVMPAPFNLGKDKTITVIGRKFDSLSKVKFYKHGFNPVIKDQAKIIKSHLQIRNQNPLNIDTKLIGEIDIKIKIMGTPHFFIGCTEDINQPIQFSEINFPPHNDFFHCLIKPESLRSYQGERINYIVMKFPPQQSSPSVVIDYIRFLPKSAKYGSRTVGSAQEMINNQIRNGIFMQCPGSAEYKLRVPEGGFLNFGMGILSPQKTVTFSVWLKDRNKGKKLFQQHITDSERWFDASFEIPPQDNKDILLKFKCDSKQSGCIAFWSNPYFIGKDAKVEKPNVIVYLIDALRADSLGAYGYHRKVSPYMDKIAQQGVLFLNCYSASSWTRPAVPSLLTSLYPPAHGVSDYIFQLPDSVETLAEILRAHGYLTAMMTDNPHVGSTANMQQGFDFLLEQPAVSGLFKSRDKDIWLAHNSAALLNEKVFPWLEHSHHMPFFLYIHNMDVHAPYIPPPPFNDIFDAGYQGKINGTFDKEVGFRQSKTAEDVRHVKALYDSEIRNVDEYFHRLMVKMKNLKIENNTFFIITADHGEEFLDHNGWNHGRTLFNELLNIPLILYYPDKLPGSKRIKTPVSIVDVMPTILDVLNIECNSYADGESLLPIINGDKRRDEYIFSSYKRRFISVIDFPWKLIFDLRTSHVELYNLQDDPKEKRNLFEQRSELVKKYSDIIMKWWQKQRKTLMFFQNNSVQRIEIKPEELEALKALGYIQG